MFVAHIICVVIFIGTLGAHEPDIDINRVTRLTKHSSHLQNLYDDRSIAARHINSVNDYDDHSSWNYEPLAPLPLPHDVPTFQDNTKTIKVHQPREDPRLFYQSDSYLKEISQENLNRDATFIYPGREVVRANAHHHHRSLPLRKERSQNTIPNGNICVRCPHDRTLVAKPGSDRVMLQYPHLVSCDNHRAPRNTRFVRMYGPMFGSLLEPGSYIIVGRIMYKNKSLHLCKMQIHVVLQSCTTPSYLIPHCKGHNKPCNFTCRDPKLELHGPSSLRCADNMKWLGSLPVCKARTWCTPPPLPDHGHLNCKGATTGSSLIEGSKCRVRCDRGWRSNNRGAAVCRRGSWTQALTCSKKIN